MAEQIRKQKNNPQKEQEVNEETVPVSSEKGEALKASMDDVLDEIDDLLEETEAEEFVKNYVQKGGQ